MSGEINSMLSKNGVIVKTIGVKGKNLEEYFINTVEGDYISLKENEGFIITEFINGTLDLKDEDIGKLFDRFYTADKSRNDRNTGLGLAIIKSLVGQCFKNIKLNNWLIFKDIILYRDLYKIVSFSTLIYTIILVVNNWLLIK
jgi:hypothetical protein